MPFWLLIAGAFAGFIWWVGNTAPDKKPSTPSAAPSAKQSAGLGLGALGLMLLLRLGPWRAWAFLSSAAAAAPFLARLLQWQGQSPSPRQPHRAPQLTREEAANLLDVEPNASREDIEAAYRKLMARVHPDTGGNAYLAQLVNQARDRLLG